MPQYNMDPEGQKEEGDKAESGWTPFETKCRNVSFGCHNRWFRIELNPVVTIISALCIWGMVAWCMIEPDKVRLCNELNQIGEI